MELLHKVPEIEQRFREYLRKRDVAVYLQSQQGFDSAAALR